MRPFMSVMKNKLFSDHLFSFRLLFLSISEYTLLIQRPGIAFAGNMLLRLSKYLILKIVEIHIVINVMSNEN